MAIKCRNCETYDNPEDAALCVRCGAALPTVAGQKEIQSRPIRKRRTRGWVLIILAIIILGMAVVVCYEWLDLDRRYHDELRSGFHPDLSKASEIAALMWVDAILLVAGLVVLHGGLFSVRNAKKWVLTSPYENP
jgi:hypothetical protein